MSTVILAVLALAAADGATLSRTPTPAELAEALRTFTGKTLATADVRRVSCKGVREEPTEFVCKWRQRSGKHWRNYASYLAINGRGIQLIDNPTPIR